MAGIRAAQTGNPGGVLPKFTQFRVGLSLTQCFSVVYAHFTAFLAAADVLAQHLSCQITNDTAMLKKQSFTDFTRKKARLNR